MTVLVARQPHIEPDLSEKTSIALNLFDTILRIATTQVELEHSWAAIEWDITTQEQVEFRHIQLRNQLYFLFQLFAPSLIFYPFLDA